RLRMQTRPARPDAAHATTRRATGHRRTTLQFEQHNARFEQRHPALGVSCMDGGDVSRLERISEYGDLHPPPHEFSEICDARDTWHEVRRNELELRGRDVEQRFES